MRITTGLLMLQIAFAAFPILKADVIDFNTLPGNNKDPFTTYTENGFTVSATSGPWSVATLFGNPVPDVFCFNCNPGTLEVTGGQFNFEGVDLGDAAPPPFSYTITGYLNGSQVLLQSGVSPAAVGTFATIASAETTQLLDRLDISINTASTDGNVDNIVVNSVPEPGTWILLLLVIGVLARSFRTYRTS
jgi:hypothetical protein